MNMSIGQRIGNLRKNKGYSQEYVAERLEVSRQAVSKWENDTSAPDTYNLIALAELFDVSVEYIAIGKQAEQAQNESTAWANYRAISLQRILGIVFIGIGLLSLILGILLSEALIVLSFYLITLGTLFVAVRKRLWFASMWSLLGVTFLLIHGNLLCIFNPLFYTGGISNWLIVAYLFWIWLIVACSVTAVMIIKKQKDQSKR